MSASSAAGPAVLQDRPPASTISCRPPYPTASVRRRPVPESRVDSTASFSAPAAELAAGRSSRTGGPASRRPTRTVPTRPPARHAMRKSTQDARRDGLPSGRPPHGPPTAAGRVPTPAPARQDAHPATLSDRPSPYGGPRWQAPAQGRPAVPDPGARPARGGGPRRKAGPRCRTPAQGRPAVADPGARRACGGGRSSAWSGSRSPVTAEHDRGGSPDRLGQRGDAVVQVG